MKLAEALTVRSDLQKRIAQIKSRLLLNAKVQEGEKPAEEPAGLLEELNRLVASLDDLVTRINQTNSQTMDGGQTITALLARRDGLGLKTGIMRDFLSSASAVVVRGTKSEIKVKSAVSVPSLQKEVDQLSKELRELDIRIQALNWTTELI